MINALASISFFAFFGSAIIAPFLPLVLLWRTVAFSALMFLAYQLVKQPLHWSDGRFADALGLVLAVLVVGVATILLTIRLVVAAYRDKLRKEFLIGRGMRGIDRLLLVLAGAVGGLLLTIQLAYFLGLTGGGVFLDLGIAIAALAAGMWMAFRARKPRFIPLAVAFFVLAMISLAGAGQTSRILACAEVLADGSPWCIYGPNPRDQEITIAKLGFFSLRKGGVLPHLGLLIQNGSSIKRAHWSIRKQRFMEGVFLHDRSCEARIDFAKGLKW